MKNRIKRVLLFLGTFIVMYSLIISAIAPQRYDLNVSDIAKSDIKAPRETIDEKSSKAKLDQAIANVDKQYTKKNEVNSQAEDALKDFFTKLISAYDSNADINDKVKNVKANQTLLTDDSKIKVLLLIPRDNTVSLENDLISIVDKVYESKIEDGDTNSITAAKKLADSKIDSLNYSTDTLDIIKSIVEPLIKPNFFFDQEKTNEMIQEVEKNTEKVVIKKNQIIVKEGEPITQDQIDILNQLGLLSDNGGKEYFLLYVVGGAFLGVVQVIMYSFLYRNHRKIFADTKKMLLINLLLIMSIAFARIVNYASPYLIPFAFVPILIALLINTRISLFTSVLNVILIGAVTGFDSQIMLVALVNAIVGATVIKKLQQRNDIFYATLFISVIIAIFNFSYGMLLTSNVKEILLNTLFAVVGVLFSGVLAIGILPFLEASFDIVTTLKLLELSNPNSPLLKKLLMEAPGTYHHSMLIANLAEMAADEVGANPVVARIGAYYHDIGKTKRPYFFKENQITKENPHNKINVTLSTLIIKSHVKDGVDLAKEYKLPRVIQDIIAQHHGTTLVKYFYFQAKNNCENEDEVKIEDYSYPGPIPSTKEAGIIMLADSTEAAVRSIVDPSKEKLEKMVFDIIEDRLHTGQLDDCDLTLRDLSKIRKCFLKALGGIYHQRIVYPSEKTKL